jgi:hypothetical protein
MGSEQPNKNFFDDILRGLDEGTIVRGDKEFKTITIDGMPIHYNRTSGKLYYTENGVTTHAEITLEGEVTNIQLTESVTEKPYTDRELARTKRQFLESIVSQLRP